MHRYHPRNIGKIFRYHSGRKVIEERLRDLQAEISLIRSATPVYNIAEGNTHGKALAGLHEAYAQGKAGLQPLFIKGDGNPIARPLIFEETIDTIVNSFESGKKELLMLWTDTCTGQAYKAGTSKFKLVPVSHDLILLGEDFSSPFVLVNYANQDGNELDANHGKYNVPLRKSEVLNNHGWCESVQDRSLLKAIRDIVYAELKRLGRDDEAMTYHIRTNPQQDCLRVLEVRGIKDGFDADHNYGLDSPARFVLVSPKYTKERKPLK